jgi:hypothetical protein
MGKSGSSRSVGRRWPDPGRLVRQVQQFVSYYVGKEDQHKSE